MSDESQHQAHRTEQIAFLVICRECDHENWLAGPQFPTLVDYAEQNFECLECGRQLKTGEKVHA